MSCLCLKLELYSILVALQLMRLWKKLLEKKLSLELVLFWCLRILTLCTACLQKVSPPDYTGVSALTNSLAARVTRVLRVRQQWPVPWSSGTFVCSSIESVMLVPIGTIPMFVQAVLRIVVTSPYLRSALASRCLMTDPSTSLETRASTSVPSP